MLMPLDQRPTVVPGETVNSKARSWAATLTDDRFQLQVHQQATGFTKVDVLRALEGEAAKEPMKNLGKLLLVTSASHTQVFITFHKSLYRYIWRSVCWRLCSDVLVSMS